MALPEISFELILLFVLMLTLVYARKLDRSLAAVRNNPDLLQEKLVQVSSKLDVARAGIGHLVSDVEQAEAALAQSQARAMEAGQQLQALVLRAEEASKQLSRRPRKASAPAMSPPSSKAERDLVKALNLG